MGRAIVGMVVALSARLLTPVPASAESYILNEIVLPFAGVTATSVTAINDANQMVGEFRDASGIHGFLYEEGQFRKLDVPFSGGTETIPVSINNSGEIVGEYRDANGVVRGFFYAKGQFARFDLPFATETQPFAINDSGHIVGVYANNRGVHGFLYAHGRFVTIDVPLEGVQATRAFGLNNRGQIVGQYQLAVPPGAPPFTNPVTPGFLLDKGQFRLLDLTDFSGFLDINDKGDFVVQCTGILACDGFFSLFSNGQFEKITLPETSEVFGLENRDQLVGSYVDDAGRAAHGFVAEPMRGVSFVPILSTYSASRDTRGCPSGFTGTFKFTARLTNHSAKVPLTAINLRVTTLTNGNLLQNATRYDVLKQEYRQVPGGAGATLHISEQGGFADGFLTTGESVDVDLVICLKTPQPFNFLVGLYAFHAGSSW